MTYDPNWPQTGQIVDADRFREQFAGVVAMLDSGSAITSVVVEAVNTLPPGSAAEATVTLTDGVLRFVFSLPQGEGGPPGTPGEVSQAELAAAISGTALNPSSVSPVGTYFSDPVTAGDLNLVAGKLDELISVLQRNP